MPEVSVVWDEPEPEFDSNAELAGDLISIPFEILFSLGSQSILAGYDSWKEIGDPGRNISDPYLQAAIRLRDAKSSRLRERSVEAMTSIPDPAAARGDLKKALRYDPAVNVRKSAAVALGKIGDADSLDYLNKAMLYDSSAEVRRVCSLIVARSQSKQDTGVSKTSGTIDTDSKSSNATKPGVRHP